MVLAELAAGVPAVRAEWGPVFPGASDLPQSLSRKQKVWFTLGQTKRSKITRFQLDLSALKMSLMQKYSCHVCGKALGNTSFGQFKRLAMGPF